jgi:hypothetical protein
LLISHCQETVWRSPSRSGSSGSGCGLVACNNNVAARNADAAAAALAHHSLHEVCRRRTMLGQKRSGVRPVRHSTKHPPAAAAAALLRLILAFFFCQRRCCCRSRSSWG